MTVESITDVLVEMMRYSQEKNWPTLTHNVAGFNVTLQRFESLRWSVECIGGFTSNDPFEVAEFLHANRK